MREVAACQALESGLALSLDWAPLQFSAPSSTDVGAAVGDQADQQAQGEVGLMTDSLHGLSVAEHQRECQAPQQLLQQQEPQSIPHGTVELEHSQGGERGCDNAASSSDRFLAVSGSACNVALVQVSVPSVSWYQQLVMAASAFHGGACSGCVPLHVGCIASFANNGCICLDLHAWAMLHGKCHIECWLLALHIMCQLHRA
jgi:hypothetical protein